jgi:predicted nucleotidyltransferase
MNIFRESSEVEEFIKTHRLNLKAFERCNANSNKMRNSLECFYTTRPASEDVDFVVFGSLARNECVGDSDVDWTLLIDGQANAGHLKYANDIRRKIKDNFKEPGKSGTFGNTTISHDLIHYIGGEYDSNKNITRRILLLLESEKINFTNDQGEGGSAYDRVVRGILGQYFDHDSGLRRTIKESIPRFLLNDLIRFWRTMCVDFAYKQKEEEGQKWALRNIKLRMSRKLIYVKGLLMCFSQYGIKHIREKFIASMRDMVNMHPFELMISLRGHFEIKEEDIVRLLTSYDQFLLEMDNDETRKTLETIDMDEVYSDSTFQRLRENGDIFRDTLDDVFLRKNSKLNQLTLKYGFF